ncbi:aminoglycoside phosphotransferase family protein [Aliiglaciecola litoralis]|uniref:Phosphotransferase n=1 Tax=Aliiglaciecola litoralis TaxID=582857 RepID=A0ABN1LQP8_9ALTE
MTDKQQRQQALLNWINSDTGFSCQSLDIVSGDASFRRYFRFTDLNTQQSIIAVDAPPKFEDSSKFVDIAKAYHAAGVHVPKVYCHDPAQGFYCLQDFGNHQFALEVQSANVIARYKQAIDQLPSIQACVSVNNKPLPWYDDQLLATELHLFTHWLMEVHLGLVLDNNQRKLVQDCYDYIADIFKAQPQVGVHRDYHSRNLMVLDDNRIGVIDFQDAVIGPITYDLVSLLRDCYQSWSSQQIAELLAYTQQTYYPNYDLAQFTFWFDMTGIQRHIKASGIFCRLCHRDGKQGYLHDIPHTLDYIIDVAGRYTETREFANFVATIVKPKFVSITQ